jgi:galactokinase/mevalonate kinase-like predicted kinase
MRTIDICVVTASNERQADSFRKLLGSRTGSGLYPREIDFLVCPDPDGVRVGSGGGTVNALRYVLDRYKADNEEEFFAAKRILILHAGGESRRLPLYAPEGKLFAPVPAATSCLIPPVVLDLQLNLYLRYPWADGEIVVASGDVIVDFETGQIPEARGDLCGFAARTSTAQGAQHGVYSFDESGSGVKDYFQKQSEGYLRQHAVFEGTDSCAMDIGIVALSPKFASSLLRVAEDALQFSASPCFFNLYDEVLNCCIPGIDYGRYLARCGESGIPSARKKRLFGGLHEFRLNGVLTEGTTFLHLGSLSEYPRACKVICDLGMKPFYVFTASAEISPRVVHDSVCFNSEITASLSGASLQEGLLYSEGISSGTVRSGAGGLVVGLSCGAFDTVLPAGICLEERRIEAGPVYAVYSVRDTFRPAFCTADMVFCGVPFPTWLSERNLSESDIWPEEKQSDLYTAKLFSARPDIQQLSGYWQAPTELDEWRSTFLNAKRFSLQELNDRSDAFERQQYRVEIRKRLLRERIDSGLGWQSVPVSDFSSLFAESDLRRLREMLDATRDLFLRQYREECLRAVESVSDANAGQETSTLVFWDRASRENAPLLVALKSDQIVWGRCPLRFDLAGGWTDTPPFTNRFGGEVVNIAVTLNGQQPVQVFVRPTRELHIRFHSIDLGLTETIYEKKSLSDYQNASSAFALPKAALCLLGLGNDISARSLRSELKRIGSGIEISLLCAVPKGSGLGTSSILGATIMAALHRFFGIQLDKDELFLQVLQMEQMLTTGGGWQDQIGGVEGGVKYISSKPAERPEPLIHHLDDYLFTSSENRHRYTLFYTGITRLAKNILQEVVSHVNSYEPAYLFTHQHLRELVTRTRLAILRRDYHGLARVLSDSWKANKLIHPSTTNPEVEELLISTQPNWHGMKLLGAGGGGYALFASPTEKASDELKGVLDTWSGNGGARIVDFGLDNEGLVVTVS